MKDITVYKGEDILPDQKEVFHLLDCREDSHIYQEMLDLYEELQKDLKHIIHPLAAMTFGRLEENTEVLYCIMTLGKETDAYTRAFFEEEEYLKGMLSDAMADSCLFTFEKSVVTVVKNLCRKRKKGIKCRHEAPNDIPMEIQKTAYEALDAGKLLKLRLTDGLMFQPIKTLCAVFELSDREEEFHTEHDCASCCNITCKLRKPGQCRVKVIAGDKEYKLCCTKGTYVLPLLHENSIFPDTPCGGNGICGKCRLQVQAGTIEITKEDRKKFREKELAAGMRLACRAQITEDCIFSIEPKPAEEFFIPDTERKDHGSITADSPVRNTLTYGIAIDIGTTTLALSLYCLEMETELDVYTGINHQRAFGADVIARIQASNEGKDRLLRKSIQKDLLEGMQVLIQRNQIQGHRVKIIAIAGNTVMQHLLLGYSCKTLGVHPFQPVSLELSKFPFRQVFEGELLPDAKVHILPGISAFVGADIVSGLYYLDFCKQDKLCALIDLGTNGEMALGNKDKLLVTSTAAGPAFEGGNLEWGVGSIPGAIYTFHIEKENTEFATIHNRPPIGICGTGAIEITAELLINKKMDETGKLTEALFDHGIIIGQTKEKNGIVFSQKDIREIQLAKAAVRAGLEILLLEYGASYDMIDTLYLAGGFGLSLNVKKAAEIGLLPRELTDRTIAVGNTSLKGALRYIRQEKEAMAQLTAAVSSSKAIQLATNQKFSELYMEHILFPVT